MCVLIPPRAALFISAARGGLCAGIDKLCFECYNKTYIKKRPIELHRRSIMENVGNLQSYRKGVKLLDATLRDGGIVNSFYFKDDFVKALYEANLAAGVDIMEFGYKVSKRCSMPPSSASGSSAKKKISAR